MKVTDWTLHTPDERFHVFVEILTGESGWPVSHCAANALDEMMGTEFIEKRVDGVSTVPEGPPNPQAVREQALAHLEQLRREKGI